MSSTNETMNGLNLKAYINGKEYSNIVQGISFEDEYNEKLDSGSIIITNIEKIENLKPYDDVYIYNGDDDFIGFNNYKTDIYNINFKSYQNVSEGTWDVSFRFDNIDIVNLISVGNVHITFYIYDSSTGDTYTNEDDYYYDNFSLIPINNTSLPTFIFHEAQEDRVYIASVPNLSYVNVELSSMYVEAPAYKPNLPSYYKHMLVDQFTYDNLRLGENVYKYKIQLFSEAKYLETIQLPNISITQPIKFGKKINVYDYLVKYINMYSPVVKIKSDTGSNTWIYRKKYTLSEDLKDIFSDIFAPNISMTSPNLRELLSQLFIVKDRIPYVFNNEIRAMDITERKGTFDLKGTKYVSGSMTSDNYCDNLKREYNNALSQANTTKNIEYLGFRNRDNALMTIGNMRLETSYPIYKIDKCLMCYYTKMDILNSETNEHRFVQFLCKQDITKLVKLNSERNLLSKDWKDFSNDNPPTNIDELSEYKLSTVGYDIGSKYITGWGTTYTYPFAFWDITKSYIENIGSKVNLWTPFGIYNYGYISSKLSPKEVIILPLNESDFIDNLIAPQFSATGEPWDQDVTSKLKGIFFQVEYESFYNGSIIHSKDNSYGDITMNDNSSASLTLLEKDGLFEKEKINRFGNETLIIQAFYDNNDGIPAIDKLQPLGSVYGDDNIIFHREYSIFNNVINCTYYAVKDYVLKNYYTSVFAKLRTYNLMSYNDSVRRSENKKMFLLLSKNNSYFEKDNDKLSFNSFNYISPLKTIMSFFVPSEKAFTIDNFIYRDKINYGYISFEKNGFTYNYACDLNAFVSGTSLCFNLSMFDNVSAGVYISDAMPRFNYDVTDDFVGSVQSWYLLVDDSDTGFTKKLGFYICHHDNDNIDSVVEDYNINNIRNAYDKILQLPKIENEGNTNIIGKEYEINKDNKEQIDMTFQIEPITDSNDILFSSYLMKLSDLLAEKDKVIKDYQVSDSFSYNTDITALAFVTQLNNIQSPILISCIPTIMFKVGKDIVNNIGANSQTYFKRFSFTFESITAPIKKYEYEIHKIVSIDENKMVISGVQYVTKIETVIVDFGTVIKKPVLHVDTDVELTLYSDYSKANDDSDYLDNLYFSTVKYVTVGQQTNASLHPENIIKFTDSRGNVYVPSEDGTFRRTIYNNDEDYTYVVDNIQIHNYNQENTDIGVNAVGLSKNKTYYKNMYLVESENQIDKSIIYREYKAGELPVSTLKVNDIIQYKENDDNVPYIRIDLSNISPSSKSLQYWYLDTIRENEDEETGTADISQSTYKFVFGVNISENDMSNGYINVYLSMMSNRNNTILDINHLAIGKNYNYTNNSEDYKYGNIQYYEKN